ncbi:chemotaxis protein CheD [Parvularcula lutaonensis]|uniref:Probable chemoreceptor glutamine deamidase CheD n=1 Tax=Parvularcula lutaonensis TaxID=491923 RepID=A0ABV7MCY5_9PROT|nr:chemotaxis protein CheD [Parvularcula lutaonensis]GGY39294.1 putative chemoreceptor glutamine deamidase CheD [Parvularcula lutaonensis]
MRPVSDYARAGRRPPTLIGVGGIAWSGDSAVVYSTLLGSCIAVCLWDKMAMKGGLIHFLLAKAPSEDCDDTRYGEVSLPLLVNNLCAVGCMKHRLQAIVAGGADLLSNMQPIGTENTEFALEWLRKAGIPIIKKDYGGSNARRVRFYPTTGLCEITTIEGATAPPRG